MGGAAYAAKGTSTGQAPTTVFFGAVPDKYNMLLSYYYKDTGSVASTVMVDVSRPATNINTWIPWDQSWGGGGASSITASIGATVTAPDGTSTAHHVIEGTNNGYHIMVAGYQAGLQTPERKRLAAFVQKAERTRCFLMLGNFVNMVGQGNRYEGGVYCVFDLAGGQIGVPPTQITGGFTYNYTPIGSGIIPFGNGWYLCYIDVSLATNAFIPFNNIQAIVEAVIGPDAGSGTGAANFKYVGDGTSGINVWNTNLLHPRAWGMQSSVYFEDFLSLANVDVNNTQAPGFSLYVAGDTWPQQDNTNWWTPTPPGILSVSGSVLTVPSQTNSPGIPGGKVAQPTTATWNTTTLSVVGNVWKPPFIFEWKGSYDQSSTNSDELAYWALPIEMQTLFPNTPARNTGQFYHENDIVDSLNSNIVPLFAYLSNPFLLTINLSQWQGYPGWSSVYSYSTAFTGIYWNGHLYNSLINSNAGNQPDISPGAWSDQGAPTNPVGFGSFFDQAHATQNVHTLIRIEDRSKYAPFDDTGMIAIFFNGVHTTNQNQNNFGQVTYGAYWATALGGTFASGQPLIQTGDAFHYFLILGPSRFRNIYTDSLRVIQ